MSKNGAHYSFTKSFSRRNFIMSTQSKKTIMKSIRMDAETEKNILSKAAKQNMSFSQYMIYSSLNGNFDIVYSEPFHQAMQSMNILYHLANDISNEEIKKEMQKEIEKIWLSLK